MEEQTIQEETKKNKNRAGFWKGFLCAAVIFSVISVISAGLGAYMSANRFLSRQGITSGKSDESNLITADKTVQEKLEKLEYYIRTFYLEEVDDQKLEDYLYYGLIAGIDDPYAAYYNEEETQSMLDSSNGSYCGIGAVFSQNMVSKIVTVSRVYEGYPACEAGILPGDVLCRVEGEEISGQDLTSIVTKIKGEADTEVTISMLREEEILDFTLKRQEIHVPTVEYKMLSGQNGYIQITEFDHITVEQFEEALTALKADGMERLIIDLRNNGGGNVDAVCQIADVLLPEGLIVATEYKNGRRDEMKSDAQCLDIPMAVLVNGSSASASEILAGALKDYGVATIVGTQTFGKGIVQSVYDLQDGTALKLTTAKYYTPNGNNIHGVGITPDVEIELPEELKTKVSLTPEEDVQLQKAIEVLQQ